MASSDAVNSQITDSVTQVNTKVVGEAPAVAMGNLYQALSQATGVALQNAVHAQNGQVALNGAATTEAVNMLFESGRLPDTAGAGQSPVAQPPAVPPTSPPA